MPSAGFSPPKEKLRSLAQPEESKPAERPRVGLALAGGFARGIAHIGVLRILREAGIPIDVVAGTSVGALIGAAFCAGTPLEEMERIGASTNFTDFGRWTPSWLGLATNQRLEKFFARFTAGENFRGDWPFPWPSPRPTLTPASPSTTRVVRRPCRCARRAPIRDSSCPFNMRDAPWWMDFLPRRFPWKARCFSARTL